MRINMEGFNFMAITKKLKKKTTKKLKDKKVASSATRRKGGIKVLRVGKKVVRKKIVKKKKEPVKLVRSIRNPIIEPRPYSWESQAVFNPAVVSLGGKVHLFYRALGEDGISRLGYASSKDGINFDERLVYPVYSLEDTEKMKRHWPFTSPARPVYDNSLYASGGGWGGCEDPRAVLIEGYIYVTLNIFNGWESMRVAVVSIKEENLLNKKWFWQNFSYLSQPGDR
jgi:hypothetical protein